MLQHKPTLVYLAVMFGIPLPDCWRTNLGTLRILHAMALKGSQAHNLNRSGNSSKV